MMTLNAPSKRNSKLALSKETLRVLSEQDLTAVHGGGSTVAVTTTTGGPLLGIATAAAVGAAIGYGLAYGIVYGLGLTE